MISDEYPNSSVPAPRYAGAGKLVRVGRDNSCSVEVGWRQLVETAGSGGSERRPEVSDRMEAAARDLVRGRTLRGKCEPVVAPPRFPLGHVVATTGALEALAASGVCPAQLLGRHQSGDWGEIPREDAQENERSVEHGFRIISSYAAGEERIWIITEADRSSTCLLLPSEY